MTALHEREVNRQLSREAVHAVMAQRLQGTSPNEVDHPMLLGLWRAARTAIVAAGQELCPANLRNDGITYAVAADWDVAGNLSSFELRSLRSSAVILRGDRNGPLFNFKRSGQP